MQILPEYPEGPEWELFFRVFSGMGFVTNDPISFVFMQFNHKNHHFPEPEQRPVCMSILQM